MRPQRRAGRAHPRARTSVARMRGVNCVSPGWIEPRIYGALRRKDHTQHPVGRPPEAADIPGPSPGSLTASAPGFVTGANIVRRRGMTRKDDLMRRLSCHCRPAERVAEPPKPLTCGCPILNKWAVVQRLI